MYSSSIIPSPLGDLVAIASDDHLVMLEFADSEELEEKVARLTKSPFVIPSETEESLFPPLMRNKESVSLKMSLKGIPTRWQKKSKILEQTEQELGEYFEWQRKHFDIPLIVDGTLFQKDAWQWLQAIPYGETRSYGEQARMISRPKAVRAIGGANHNNRIVIIIPCHRVIGASGKLVGYGGGMERKIWLLEHEKKYR
jgi:methylated-DNA-[protein]-cysteine S-methyltransferase